MWGLIRRKVLCPVSAWTCRSVILQAASNNLASLKQFWGTFSVKRLIELKSSHTHLHCRHLVLKKSLLWAFSPLTFLINIFSTSRSLVYYTNKNPPSRTNHRGLVSSDIMLYHSISSVCMFPFIRLKELHSSSRSRMILKWSIFLVLDLSLETQYDQFFVCEIITLITAYIFQTHFCKQITVIRLFLIHFPLEILEKNVFDF